MGVIANEWRDFEKAVLSNVNAGEVQRREMRRAFYAGSLSLFSSIMNILDEGVEPTAKDLVVMDSISEELKQYQRDLETGRA